MTTGVAAIPLTYDGADLQAADLSLFLEITQGLSDGLEVRGKDIVIPYRDGQWSRPRRVDTRRLVLTGHVMGVAATTEEARGTFRSIMRYLSDELFALDRDPADLVAALEFGLAATIAARPLSIVIAEQVPSEFARVSVELLSVGPDWAYDPIEGSGS
jgi:hypothetical protein